MRSISWKVALSLLAVLSFSALRGQETRGSIGGTVLDPSGASIPNVVVTATNTASPYSMAFNGIYEMPFGTGKKFVTGSRLADRLAGGWQIGLIVSAQAGPPLGFGNALLTGGLNDIQLPGGERTIDRWFNTAVFNRNTAQQLALNYVTLSSRLSGVHAPGMAVWNGCLMKTTAIRESFRLQIKADAANMFNQPNFAAPNTSPTSTAFGRITSTSTFARIIQLGAKLIW